MNRKSILLPEGVTNELAERLLDVVEAELGQTRLFSFEAPVKVIELTEETTRPGIFQPQDLEWYTVGCLNGRHNSQTLQTPPTLL